MRLTNAGDEGVGMRLAIGAVLVTLAVVVPLAAQVHHYEYVFPDGFIYIYDIDNNFSLVKTIKVPTTPGTKGTVASAATGMLYISYGPDDFGGNMLKYDLVKDQVVWQMSYPFGIDSMSISPDGSTIYMPAGELNPTGMWWVIDAASGNVTGSIDSGGMGPHNTIVNGSGTHVYMGPRDTNYLVEADAATHKIIQKIGPVTEGLLGPGIRPFAINGAETLAFISVTGLLGFQVGDIATGKMLYTVPIQGFTWNYQVITSPSHGISLSPDEKELYVMDAPNSYVHVYDVTGLPGFAPKQVADIPLVGKESGNEQGCAYDCEKDGWLHHSQDGRYVFVADSGDVIDTTTRKTVATLPALANTRKAIEIDFQNGVPVWAMINRTSIGANLNGILSAASYASGPVSPGEFIYLAGSNLGPATLTTGLATTMGATQVLFDGTPAPVIYASATQTSAIVPYEIAGKSTTSVQVSYHGVLSNPVIMQVAASAPGLFTVNASGSGQGAILNQDNSPNGSSNPAAKGSVVQVFGTGEGLTNPQLTTGSITSGMHNTALPVTATVGGRPAVAQFAGSAPGEVAGILQVNVVIPSDAPSGSDALVITVGTASTQTGVTVSVQ